MAPAHAAGFWYLFSNNHRGTPDHRHGTSFDGILAGPSYVPQTPQATIASHSCPRRTAQFLPSGCRGLAVRRGTGRLFVCLYALPSTDVAAHPLRFFAPSGDTRSVNNAQERERKGTSLYEFAPLQRRRPGRSQSMSSREPRFPICGTDRQSATCRTNCADIGLEGPPNFCPHGPPLPVLFAAVRVAVFQEKETKSPSAPCVKTERTP